MNGRGFSRTVGVGARLLGTVLVLVLADTDFVTSIGGVTGVLISSE